MSIATEKPVVTPEELLAICPTQSLSNWLMAH